MRVSYIYLGGLTLRKIRRIRSKGNKCLSHSPPHPVGVWGEGIYLQVFKSFDLKVSG